MTKMSTNLILGTQVQTLHYRAVIMSGQGCSPELQVLLWTHSCVHEEILPKASSSIANVSAVRKCRVMQLAPCPLT